MQGRVLIIAGSDSGGGAGIQADIKTVTALSGYAMTAITALTAQNTEGVFGVHEVPEAFIREQIRVVLSDIGADCIKIGMLHRASVIKTVAETISALAPGVLVVLDPVMIAKGGHSLLEPDALDALKRHLIPLATLVTPNVPEAEALSGHNIACVADMGAAAEAIASLGGDDKPEAVLIKGGHMTGETLSDVLWFRDAPPEIIEGNRIDSTSTHGTGCTLASAIACSLAQGMDLKAAALRARNYVVAAIETAPGLGKGHGPLNHAHTCRKFD